MIDPDSVVANVSGSSQSGEATARISWPAPSLLLPMAGSACLLPLVSIRIGYAERFELRFQDLGFDGQELIWGALFGILTLIWLSAMLFVLVEPLFVPGRAHLIVGRDTALFCLRIDGGCAPIPKGQRHGWGRRWARTLDRIPVRNGEPDRSNLGSWPRGRERKSRRTGEPERISPRVLTLAAVPLLALPEFVFSLRNRGRWCRSQACCLRFRVCILFYTPLGVGMTSIISTLARHDSPPIRIAVAAGLLFAFLCGAIGALTASLPHDPDSDPSFGGFVVIEILIVLAVLARLSTVQTYIGQQFQHADAAIVAVVSIVLFLTCLACYSWGWYAADDEMRGREADFDVLMGLHVPTVCIAPSARKKPGYEGTGLLLGSENSRYVVWISDVGTVRVAGGIEQSDICGKPRRNVFEIATESSLTVRVPPRKRYSQRAAGSSVMTGARWNRAVSPVSARNSPHPGS